MTQSSTSFRAFFGAALKGNSHLFKGVLTGILRISKESIFSDLNNLNVATLLDPEFSDAFGFTEDEVAALFASQGRTDRLEDARRWYNGYRFGPHVVYNPWSLLNFLAKPHAPLQAYWLNSSSNDLIKEPEALYHGLMLGLCAAMEPVHRVRSNRETGFGRADLLVIPRRPGEPGAVLELKVAEEGWRTMDEAVAEGRTQLEEKKYATELSSAGASPIQKWVLAFDGKKVRVEYLGAEPPGP